MTGNCCWEEGNDVAVIPVFYREVTIEDYDFKKLQGTPRDQKWIKPRSDQDAANREVEQFIRAKVHELLGIKEKMSWSGTVDQPVGVLAEVTDSSSASTESSGTSEKATDEKADKEAQAEFVKKQTQKLARLLEGRETSDKDKAQAIKSAFIVEYTPGIPDIEADKLAEVVADTLCNLQGAPLDEALDRAGGLFYNFYRTYPAENDRESIAKQTEKLFTVCVVLAFPECRIENDKAGTEKPHIVAVSELQTLECVAAKLYEQSPSFVTDIKESVSGARRKGKYAHTVEWGSLRDGSWETEDKAKEFIRVFLDQLTKASKLDTSSPAKVNSLLKLGRRRNEFHYLYLNTRTSGENIKWISEVVEFMHKDKNVPEIPVFYFGEEENELIGQVSANIDRFYADLDKYRQGRLV